MGGMVYLNTKLEAMKYIEQFLMWTGGTDYHNTKLGRHITSQCRQGLLIVGFPHCVRYFSQLIKSP